MKRQLALVLVLAALAAAPLAARQPLSQQEERARAELLYKQGNYNDALAIFRKLVLCPTSDSREASHDLSLAVACLSNLNRENELDELLDKAEKARRNDFRMLWAVAEKLADINHEGFVVSGEFSRGQHRGGDGKYVYCYLRDRARAMEILSRAMPTARKQADGQELANFYLSFARIVMGPFGASESWRLSVLTDLNDPPDCVEGYPYYYYRGGEPMGAPATQDGKPVFYSIPEAFEDAKNDGERWRFLLSRAALADRKRESEATYLFAEFMRIQFGVQTLAGYSFFSENDPDKEVREGIYSLSNLSREETIARLACGVRRFNLPAGMNYISAYQKLADAKGPYAENSINRLAEIFENRRQYDAAASSWKKSMDVFGTSDFKRQRYNQIMGNWARFDPIGVKPAGANAELSLLFRNGTRARFAAREIRMDKLLSDVMSYLESNPKELSWDKLELNNIGYRLLDQDQEKYLGKSVAQWDVMLNPAPGHFDARAPVKVPFTKAGSYLISAAMDGGNTSYIVLTLAKAAIVKKPMEGKSLLFVCEADKGRALAGAEVTVFGYIQTPEDQKYPGPQRYRVQTRKFTRTTDPNGLIMLDNKEMDDRWRYLIFVPGGENDPAILGYTGLWRNYRRQSVYDSAKAFVLTDRPVYRPGQKVFFKIWVARARYDQKNESAFSGASLYVIARNPKNEDFFQKNMTADSFGGVSGSFVLPEDCPLGVFGLTVSGYGGGTFRVEEYKKPEFEVAIEAPEKPVELGKAFSAKIKARYYFGEPVKNATVSYKVLRSEQDEAWYPPGPWDWLYGSGYGWLSPDYDWYPGWSRWGCPRPWSWWLPRSRKPPEVVARGEGRIGEDGTFTVPIETGLAKALQPGMDQRYEITAEVTDASRRTIYGKGSVLAAARPGRVYAQADRGYYRTRDSITIRFHARNASGAPLSGTGEVSVFRISYPDGKATESLSQKRSLTLNQEGTAEYRLTAALPGQFRAAFAFTQGPAAGIEGGCIFTVLGDERDTTDFSFNDLELVPEKAVYRPGETASLAVRTRQAQSTVLLFLRPEGEVYPAPEVMALPGKTGIVPVAVAQGDMPNFYVEALTVSGAEVHTTVREILVPPESRVLNLSLASQKTVYEPGKDAEVTVKVADAEGRPYSGSIALTVYDQALEYISGGSNVPEIKSFFWKWRRSHYTRGEDTLSRYFPNLVKKNAPTLSPIGVFGAVTGIGAAGGEAKDGMMLAKSEAMPMPSVARAAKMQSADADGIAMEMAAPAAPAAEAPEEGAPGEAAAVLRENFADSAFFAGDLFTDDKGLAKASFAMPDNLTGWQCRAWVMGLGTRVGQAALTLVTKKDLLVRLETPRFLVQTDTAVLSANVHNYLDKEKSVRVVLAVSGDTLEVSGKREQKVTVPAGGEARVDFSVLAKNEGQAEVTVSAFSDAASDAMKIGFPVLIHGAERTEPFCKVIRPKEEKTSFSFTVPEKRRVESTLLTVQFSPSLAAAMVDALPYLADYPYGCTEQTLNRFVPAAVTAKILKQMGIRLSDIRNKTVNLNPEELGDAKERAEQWKRWRDNPVFDPEKLADMVHAGISRLSVMQLSDGAWGWFSGYGEHSDPHTTATVVRGLLTARESGVVLPGNMLERGIAWLEGYQSAELSKLKNAAKQKKPYKTHTDDLDAYVYQALAEAGRESSGMREFLYRDRNGLSVYSKALLALGCVTAGDQAKVSMLTRNIKQYEVCDQENQTCYLNLGNQGYWWWWYGNEIEAHAAYLRLLCATDPRGERTAWLVKYLLNNRKNATWWGSTRDTAFCIEALADFWKVSGEDKPDMLVSVYLDGKRMKQSPINTGNLFSFENSWSLGGAALTPGKHTVTIERKGRGPLYVNAYLENFTMEDFIKSAGLELKVSRKVYRLVAEDRAIADAGSLGQPVSRKVEKYRRIPLGPEDTVQSGDLLEIELTTMLKNDYEYLIFSDHKAAGCEPVEVKSGYNGNDLGAYVEFRDETVNFFCRTLARGKHSVSYRMNAQIPGKYSALPAQGYAMYAPELRGNSDEQKLCINDKEMKKE
ncbi:MAG: MG2 domain-containing protein [Thermodesulfobacteriota bacterium]